MTPSQFWPREPGRFVALAEKYMSADGAARRIAAELGVAAPSGGMPAAAELDRARGAFVGEYAALVTQTRERMTEVAARTAVARLRALGQHPPGDPAAAGAAEVAELRGRAETAEIAEDAQRRSAELGAGHGGALGGFGGMAGLGMLGRALGGDGAHRPVAYGMPAAAPAELEHRLREVSAAVTGAPRAWVRMAVADVVDEAGRARRLIGTTELDGYLRPGVVLRDGELAAGNEEWPELSIATFCAAHGFAAGPVVGAVEPPPEVCATLRDLGFAPSWSGGGAAVGGELDDASLD